MKLLRIKQVKRRHCKRFITVWNTKIKHWYRHTYCYCTV